VPSEPNPDWIELGFAYPHWGGSCRQLGVFLGPSPGCVINGEQEICEYNVWFGSGLQKAQLFGFLVNLRFERARSVYTVTDTWSGGCNALAARAASPGQTVGTAP
jgi:hypothetical protein